jgi:hypothetical protein
VAGYGPPRGPPASDATPRSPSRSQDASTTSPPSQSATHRHARRTPAARHRKRCRSERAAPPRRILPSRPCHHEAQQLTADATYVPPGGVLPLAATLEHCSGPSLDAIVAVATAYRGNARSTSTRSFFADVRASRAASQSRSRRPLPRGSGRANVDVDHACFGRAPSVSNDDRLTLASVSDCSSAGVVAGHDRWSSDPTVNLVWKSRAQWAESSSGGGSQHAELAQSDDALASFVGFRLGR